MTQRSLSTRLLATVGVLLIVFFGVTIAALDVVYRNLTESFMRTRLELRVSNLISASDEQPDGKLMPGEMLREPRLAILDSGLYALIQRDAGEVTWWSHSLTDTQLQLYTSVAPGKSVTRLMQLPDGSEVQALSVGLEWEFPNREVHRFVYTVAEDLAPYRAELQSLREQLLVWFAGLMVLLLTALALVFGWVLKPVRRVEKEIADIEAGRASELSASYPRELAGITANMNALLRNERERLARYRNTLGNLAHSLKTPLAVLRSLSTTEQLQEQVSRMDQIVSYQLKRAAMSGSTGLGSAPIEVLPVITGLRDTLLKVYIDKHLELTLDIDPQARFIGDQGDLLEIAGNLLDNACKFCRRRVHFSASPLAGGRRDGLLIAVEDDGPGIPPEQRATVLKRGARLDERVSGQGIGLSVVHEIAALGGGGVEIDDSGLGGSKITVRLPAP